MRTRKPNSPSPETRELVAQMIMEQRRKVVVFSQWRRMLQLAHWAVGDLMEDAGLRTVYFTGRENQRRRTHNVVDFHDDPAVSLLLCSDAGQVGLNLQRAASCMVCLDLPWNPAVLEQRVGRIYRLGQKHPIEVYYLVSESGIEGRIAGLIGDRVHLTAGLLVGLGVGASAVVPLLLAARLQPHTEPTDAGERAAG